MSDLGELIASPVVEVIDLAEDSVRIRIPGNDGWVAELDLPLRYCPEPARQIGGAFYLDTYRVDGKYELRGRAVDPEEERKMIDEWFKDLDL